MNNLSQQLDSLFVDIQNKIPSFDDLGDNDCPEDLVTEESRSEYAALVAAYPLQFETPNQDEVSFLELVESSGTELMSSPRQHSEETVVIEKPNPEPRPHSGQREVEVQTILDVTSGDRIPQSSSEVNDRNNSRSFPSFISLNERSYENVTKSQIESQQLVEKYFPSSGVHLSSGSVEMEDIDDILDSLETLHEVDIPDCFQQAEIMLSDRMPRVNRNHTDNLSTIPVQNSDNSTIVLRKLILHAAKYDEGLKLKDFDLRSGSLRSHKRHKNRREKPPVEVQECWVPDNDIQQEPDTCNRGVTAAFPSDLPNDVKPTVYIDLRHDEEALEEKRRHIQRVQSILGIRSQLSDDSDDSDY